MSGDDASFDAGGAFFVSALLTAGGLLGMCAQLVWRARRRKMEAPPRAFCSTMALCLALRVAWLLARSGAFGADAASGDGLGLRLLNRLSFLLEFTAFSAYTLVWRAALAPFHPGAVRPQEAESRCVVGAARRCAKALPSAATHATGYTVWVASNAGLYCLTAVLLLVELVAGPGMRRPLLAIFPRVLADKDVRCL